MGTPLCCQLFQREISFVTSCGEIALSNTSLLLWNLLLEEKILVLYKLTRSEKGGKIEDGRTASAESVPIYINTIEVMNDKVLQQYPCSN